MEYDPPTFRPACCTTAGALIMIDYRTVKYPEKLKTTPLTLVDVQNMEHAEQANIGVAVGASQLNCKYREGVTYVVPVGSTVEPFKFDGYVAPADVRTRFEAQHTPVTEDAA
jgi:hypothetical protein